MEFPLVLVYLVPSHQVQVPPPFYRWPQTTRAMSYPHSTQQHPNNTVQRLQVQAPYFCLLGNFQAPAEAKISCDVTLNQQHSLTLTSPCDSLWTVRGSCISAVTVILLIKGLASFLFCVLKRLYLDCEPTVSRSNVKNNKNVIGQNKQTEDVIFGYRHKCFRVFDKYLTIYEQNNSSNNH